MRDKYYLGLSNICTFGEDDHPKDLMETIDKAVELIENFTRKMKAQRITRVAWIMMWDDIYLEWGIWSHKFNKLLRQRIKSLDEDKNLSDILKDINSGLTYTYAYWWNRQHWIQEVLMKKSGLGGASTKRNIEKGRRTLRAFIRGEAKQELSPAFKNLLRVLKKKDYQNEFRRPDEKKSD